MNAATDQARRRGRARLAALDPEDAGLAVAPGSELGEVVASAVAVQTALTQVPEEFRVAVVLCDLYRVPYADAAQILEVPVGTVKSRVFRGRLALADQLAPPLAIPPPPTPPGRLPGNRARPGSVRTYSARPDEEQPACPTSTTHKPQGPPRTRGSPALSRPRAAGVAGPMPDHPDREELAAFQAGDGDRRQRSGVEAHLAGCQSCAEVVASVERARSGLALLEEPALPAGLHDRRPLARPWRARPPRRPRTGVARRPPRGILPPDSLVPPAGRLGRGRRPAPRRPGRPVPGPVRHHDLRRPGRRRRARRARTEAAGGGTAPLPVIRIPGEVTAAKVQSSLTVDRRAKAALDAAAPAPPPPGRGRRRPRSTAPPRPRFGTPPARAPRPPRPTRPFSRPASPAATGIADPAARPLTPAFFVEGTYQGREATILVTTSASPPDRVDLWVFPRNNCSAPPLATERVR